MVSRFKSRCPNAAGGRAGSALDRTLIPVRVRSLSIVDESIVLRAVAGGGHPERAGRSAFPV